MKKQANVSLPANKLLWKDLVLAEAVNRLQDLDGRIERFEIVTCNEEGNAVCLISLVGQKAFIPVVVKEFILQPMDTILFRKGKKTESKYLCKRNLLELTISSSIGMPLQRPNGYSDTAVNLLSPGGGSSYANNPFYGVRNQDQGIKTASEDQYAIEQYIKSQLNELEISTEKTANLFTTLPPVQIERREVYNTLSYIDDVFKLYSPISKQASIITKDKVLELFKSLDNDTRIEKTASLFANRHVIIGDFLPRKGNVFIKEEKPIEYTSTKNPHMPTAEGIFMYGGLPMYINPVIKSLKGQRLTSYGLGVRMGEFTIAKDFSGFKQRMNAASLMEQVDELLPKALSSDLKKDSYFVLINEVDRSCTIPLKIINIEFLPKTIQIKAKTLIGANDIVEISFYNGRTIIEHETNKYLYPFNTTRVSMLPTKFVAEKDMLAYYDLNKITEVTLNKGFKGIEIGEKGKIFKVVPESEAFFVLVNRYGCSETQALAMIDKTKIQGLVHMMVKYINDEPEITKLNDQKELENNETSMMMSKESKETIDKIIKTASTFDSINSILITLDSSNDLKVKLASQDIAIDSVIDHFINRKTFLDKEASDVVDSPNANTPANENAQERIDANKTNLGVNGNMSIASPNGLLSTLMTIPKLEKNTSQITDMLIFYSLGKIKPEEKMSIMKQLKKSLEESESLLAKVLLLTQMDKMAEQDYSDIKILLSEIDSYLNTLDTSMVLF